MRRFILLAVVAVLGVALLATSAFAFDHNFYAYENYRSGHNVGNRFVRQDTLKKPHPRDVRVGRDRWQCRAKQHPYRLKCRLLVHLNGRIGGKGYIRAKGTFFHKDKHIRVVGGTRQFNGVRGKVLWNGTRVGFDLR